jgi:hypothetical protein
MIGKQLLPASKRRSERANHVSSNAAFATLPVSTNGF